MNELMMVASRSVKSPTIGLQVLDELATLHDVYDTHDQAGSKVGCNHGLIGFGSKPVAAKF
jgi:hypothetical protein